MFTGLSAFPLSPLRHDAFDESSYATLISRLDEAKVNSITALGSTGSYMYLDQAERGRVARSAIQHAENVPVLVGIGALRTSAVRALAHDAEEAGASGLLLAPVTYQGLSDEEVFTLFQDVNAQASVPLVIYGNPGTTHVRFSEELNARITTLEHVASIKIPGVPTSPNEASDRVRSIREHIRAGVTVGVSGDAAAANGLVAGCDA